MKLLPHWGDCAEEIKELKIMLSSSQQQNIDYARDLVDLACKLRMAQLAPKPSTCTDCPNNTTVTDANLD